MNLWLYSDIQEQYKISASLVVFGANTLKSAEIIKRIDELENKLKKLDQGYSPDSVKLNDFIFSYLIDTIKISLFFENYFKAELIMKNICVHRIKHTSTKLKELSKSQLKRPINLNEIQAIEPFTVNMGEKSILHESLQNNTLGFSNLISRKEYTDYYAIDSKLLQFVKELNHHRNDLHFVTGLQFTISKEFIENLKQVDNFAQKMVNKFLNR